MSVRVPIVIIFCILLFQIFKNELFHPLFCRPPSYGDWTSKRSLAFCLLLFKNLVS
ncbi:unnamed protein product [Amoebophrya sp. A120]|nr:unnamed protein product [Amoebophrya sp. A120]|eukprot:GSA120T00007633001.1